MSESSLLALSPLDGRYAAKLEVLRDHFSEFGLIHNRVRVEIEWLKALAAAPEIVEVAPFSAAAVAELDAVRDGFSKAVRYCGMSETVSCCFRPRTTATCSIAGRLP